MAQAQKSDAENTASDIKRLMKDQAFVNGQWIGADNGAIFDVFNPATGDKIGAVPDMGAAETEKAVTAAAAAFETWKKPPRKSARIFFINGMS